eukprot:scaffold37235_cov63-Phaeocystis_antarctica.AAC.3
MEARCVAESEAPGPHERHGLPASSSRTSRGLALCAASSSARPAVPMRLRLRLSAVSVRLKCGGRGGAGSSPVAPATAAATAASASRSTAVGSETMSSTACAAASLSRLLPRLSATSLVLCFTAASSSAAPASPSWVEKRESAVSEGCSRSCSAKGGSAAVGSSVPRSERVPSAVHFAASAAPPAVGPSPSTASETSGSCRCSSLACSSPSPHRQNLSALSAGCLGSTTSSAVSVGRSHCHPRTETVPAGSLVQVPSSHLSALSTPGCGASCSSAQTAAKSSAAFVPAAAALSSWSSCSRLVAASSASAGSGASASAAVTRAAAREMRAASTGPFLSAVSHTTGTRIGSATMVSL